MADTGVVPFPVMPGARPQIAVGALHACAVTAAGGVKCWGANTAGQLGTGNSALIGTNTPVDVVGLTSGVAAVVAGEEHSCALTTAGGVKCWGWNNLTRWGQAPVDIPGLASGVVGLASGEYDTCALLASGVIECWGPGGEDEMDPTTNYGPTPVAIADAPSDVTSIQMADGFGCLLTHAGGVQCWGGNTFGELGNGSMASSATPVPVTFLQSGVTWLTANGGTAACAVLAGQPLQCWGAIPAQASSAFPVAVQGLSGGVTSASMGGENYGCAILADTSVSCWSGAVGMDPIAPTPVGLSSAVYVSANEVCACALLSSGKVMCWNHVPMQLPPDDPSSCLGNGSSSGLLSPPVEVVGF
jgi:hypothetical protein